MLQKVLPAGPIDNTSNLDGHITSQDDDTTKHWNGTELETWIRATTRIANRMCEQELAKGRDKECCIQARSKSILQRFESAKESIPATLHDGLLKILLENLC